MGAMVAFIFFLYSFSTRQAEEYQKEVAEKEAKEAKAKAAAAKDK